MTVAGLLSKKAFVHPLSLWRYLRGGSFCLCWQSKPDQRTCWHVPVGWACVLALLEIIPELSIMHVCCR